MLSRRFLAAAFGAATLIGAAGLAVLPGAASARTGATGRWAATAGTTSSRLAGTTPSRLGRAAAGRLGRAAAGRRRGTAVDVAAAVDIAGATGRRIAAW